MQSFGTTQTSIIPNGAALSNPVFIGSQGIVAIDLPAAWTVADVTILVADDAGTNNPPASTAFRQVYTAGSELVLAAGGYTTASTGLAGIRLQVPPPFLIDADWIQIQSGVTGSQVNQGADRTVAIRMRPV